MAFPVFPGTHLRGRTRAEMAHQARCLYESGATVREVASALGRSYGAAHALLREAATPLRARSQSRGSALRAQPEG